MKKMLLFPHLFLVMNWAALSGLFHYLRGDRDVWVRRPASARPGLAVAAGTRT